MVCLVPTMAVFEQKGQGSGSFSVHMSQLAFSLYWDPEEVTCLNRKVDEIASKSESKKAKEKVSFFCILLYGLTPEDVTQV